jgi:hypothetical protein
MSDRKYKQPGYRAPGSSREPAERSPRPAPGAAERRSSPDRREAPRGRGLGAPTEATFRCARCGTAAPLGAALAAAARCDGCGADLHTCSNCVSFDPGARFECRREIPVRVTPKDRANRCELFDPRTRQEFREEAKQPGDARSAFDALFKL